MVYVLLLDELRQRVAAYTQAAVIAAALGGEAEPPDWYRVRADFDAHLAAPPDEERPELQTPDQIARRALGLSKGVLVG